MIDKIEPNTMVFVLTCDPEEGSVALAHRADLSEMEDEPRMFFNALAYGIVLSLMTDMGHFLDIAEIAGASEALKERMKDQEIEGEVGDIERVIPFRRNR